MAECPPPAEIGPPPDDIQDRSKLRQWWHSVLRYGKYDCYAVFLVLPTDREMMRYLLENREEIDAISGKNCLVLVMSTDGYNSVANGKLNAPPAIYKQAVKEHSRQGYSIHIAQLFGIKRSAIPCLLVFKDVRTPEHAIVSLKEMTVEEISHTLRLVFDEIDSAISSGRDVIAVLRRRIATRKIKNIVIRIVDDVRKITLETAIKRVIGI